MSFNSYALTGNQIAKKAYTSNREVDSIQKIKMTLIDKMKNKRTRVFTSFTKDNNKYDSQTLIVFSIPKKFNKTGMLTHNQKGGDSNQWLYLPALKKTRRIASGKKSGRFVGSDLTYEDLEDREVSLDNHKYLETVKLGKTKYYIIESKAKKKSTSIYTKVKSWINAKTWVVKKAEFYIKKKKAIKTIYVKRFKKFNNTWRATVTLITNHKIKHTTLLEVTKTSFNNKLRNSFFKKTILENPKKIKRYLK